MDLLLHCACSFPDTFKRYEIILYIINKWEAYTCRQEINDIEAKTCSGKILNLLSVDFCSKINEYILSLFHLMCENERSGKDMTVRMSQMIRSNFNIIFDNFAKHVREITAAQEGCFHQLRLLKFSLEELISRNGTGNTVVNCLHLDADKAGTKYCYLKMATLYLITKEEDCKTRNLWRATYDKISSAKRELMRTIHARDSNNERQLAADFKESMLVYEEHSHMLRSLLRDIQDVWSKMSREKQLEIWSSEFYNELALND